MLGTSLVLSASSWAKVGPPTTLREPSTSAQKLKRALRACKQENSKSKRKACERKARGRYRSTPKKPKSGATTGGPTPTPPRTHVEEEVGFTSVTLECPPTVTVGKPFSIGGTGAAGAAIAITYTTPASGGRETVKANSSGHFSFAIAPQEVGTYTFLASSDGVTSPECTTAAM